MNNNDEVIGVIGQTIGECMFADDSYIPAKLKVYRDGLKMYKDNALPNGPVLNYKSKKVVETEPNVNCPYVPLTVTRTGPSLIWDGPGKPPVCGPNIPLTVTKTTVIAESREIKGWGWNQAEGVVKLPDYLSITRDICEG